MSKDNANDFFNATPLPPVVDANAEDIDLFAQAIAGRFSNPEMTKLTARLSPSQHAGPSTPPRPTFPQLPQTSTPATPLARMSINRTSSPQQPVPPSLASSSDFTVATPSTVSDILCTPHVLVLDIRPHSAYAAARLPHAISLSVPSTLLKRPAFTLQKLAAMLPSASCRTRFQSWSSASRILVYDADSTTLNDGSNLLGLLRKFRTAGYTKDVAWLQGGMQALWRENRHLIDGGPLLDEDDDGDSDVLRTRDLPQAAFQQTSTILRSSPGSLTMPSSESLPQATQTSQIPGGPTSRLAAANPFYDNIRQNIELSQGITERIPLRLSPSIKLRTKELPFIWLRNIAKSAGNDEGTEALAMQFYRIELGEQRRLQGIMTHHSLQSGVVDGSTVDDAKQEHKEGRPFPYSIIAGVEKGIKNRYRNIWPFEHSRVHLKDQDHDDDYVNASFVHPLGTRRKYIATQGPLPSTFADFWSVVWQQDVHIILMLTKECEGGSIKCGKYWADGEYGPLRLRCISVSGAIEREGDAGGGESGDGFFDAPNEGGSSNLPDREDKEDNFTIRRVFELSHADHPEAQPRTVTQLQYLGWPDMDVPVNPRSLLRLLFQVDDMVDQDAVRYGHADKPSPVLLHCSAGVGRTGAFIMIDAALDGIRREIRKRATGRGSANSAGTLSLSNSSGSDGEAQSDSDAAMDVDSASPVRTRSASLFHPTTTSFPSTQSKCARLPPISAPTQTEASSPVPPQRKTGPVATLHIGGKKSERADIHVPLVPSSEVSSQQRRFAPSSASYSAHPAPMSPLLRRRLTRPDAQWPVKADFTIADADSMFVGPTPNPAFAMDVNPLSKQIRNNNSSSGEGTSSSGDKGSGSVSSGSASDGRLTGSLQKAFAHMSSTDDSPGSPEHFKSGRFKHRIVGSDGTGSGEGPGGSASESSARSSNASGGAVGGYSSSSSVGLSGLAKLAVASPGPSSGASSPIPSRSSMSNRGRHRTSKNVSIQKPSLLAPKPLHLKSQMPELTEGVETNIQSTPMSISALNESRTPNVSVRSSISSSSSLASSSTDAMSLRSSGHTTDTFDTPLSQHKASRSPSAEKEFGFLSDQSVFDYTEPRELHGDDSPPLLSSLEEPLRQILEDMREQRMSLCQSLRQYVFVHNAIIEGALMVAEEEQKLLGLEIRAVFDPDSPPLLPKDPSKTTHMMTGKRGASPTELPKENKKGDVALVKRPSVKRGKSLSGGESTSTAST